MGSTEDRLATLGRLLVTEDDVDFMYANGRPPMTEEFGDEYYEERPTQLCDDGESGDLIADRDVFTLLDGHDDYVFFGQWISGEPTVDATARFSAGAKVLASCHDVVFTNSDGGEVRFEPYEVDNPGVDEVDGLTVIRDDKPIYHYVYARYGGLIMFIYFDGKDMTWPVEEMQAVLDVAFGKLIDVGPLSLPVPSPSESINVAADEIADPPYIGTDEASCAEVAPATPISVAPTDLPPPSDATVRWTITEPESSHGVLPNDSASGLTAYATDRTLHLANDAGQDLWTWSARTFQDVDVADNVYVVGEDYQKQLLAALDPATGELNWVRGVSALGHIGSVDAVGSTVFTTGDWPLVAIDAPTGTALWRTNNSLVTAGDNVAILDDAFNGCAFVAVDRETGAVRWAALGSTATGGPVPHSVGGVVGSDSAFLASRRSEPSMPAVGDLTITAVEVTTGNPEWAVTLPMDADKPLEWVNLIEKDDVLYVAVLQIPALPDGSIPDDRHAIVAALDSNTGEALWTDSFDFEAETTRSWLLNVQLAMSQEQLIVPFENLVVRVDRTNGHPSEVLDAAQLGVAASTTGEVMAATDGLIFLFDDTVLATD